MSPCVRRRCPPGAVGVPPRVSTLRRLPLLLPRPMRLFRAWLCCGLTMSRRYPGCCLCWRTIPRERAVSIFFRSVGKDGRAGGDKTDKTDRRRRRRRNKQNVHILRKGLPPHYLDYRRITAFIVILPSYYRDYRHGEGGRGGGYTDWKSGGKSTLYNR